MADTPAVELDTPTGVVFALVETFPLDGGEKRQVLALQAEAGGAAQRFELDSDEVKKLRAKHPELDAHLGGGSKPAPAAWQAPE